MRVYVPTTVQGLRALRDTGFSAPVPGHAVTPALREWYSDGDRDELEYAASAQAALASLRLLAAAGAGARGTARRTVVAVDVPDADVRSGPSGPSEVVVERSVTLDDVVSLHVDGDEAARDVTAAITAVVAADGGDQDALFTVDGADAHELLWYDVTELDDVLALS